MSQPHHNKHQSLLSPGGGGRSDGLVSNQGRMHVNPINSELSAGGNMMRQGGIGGHNDSLNSSFDSRKPGNGGGANDLASAYGGNS
jgi:hypothetical protein